jgi:hypothetical protein
VHRTGVRFPPPPPIWGRSSIGRAPALQAGGSGFKPRRLHHTGEVGKWPPEAILGKWDRLPANRVQKAKGTRPSLTDQLEEGMTTPRAYTCTVCSAIGFWNDRRRGFDWSWFGSYAHMDSCPEDLIYCCSEDCLKAATKKIHSGEWKLPLLNKRGNVVRERKGY